jgi:hypothetical protein
MWVPVKICVPIYKGANIFPTTDIKQKKKAGKCMHYVTVLVHSLCYSYALLCLKL